MRKIYTKNKTFGITTLIIFAMVMSSAYIEIKDWVVIDAKEYGYQISFPSVPEESVQSVTTAAGPVDMHIHLLDTSQDENADNMLYLSSHAAYPDTLISSERKEQIKEFFTETIDGLVKSVDGKLLSKSKVNLEGYPGRQAKIDFQNGMAVISIRIYLVDSEVYMLQTITKTDKDKNASIEKFMNSFSLLKQ